MRQRLVRFVVGFGAQHADRQSSGLGTIPLIVHPIDTVVHLLLDGSQRKVGRNVIESVLDVDHHDMARSNVPGFDAKKPSEPNAQPPAATILTNNADSASQKSSER